jgi:hypothetical protein
MEIEAETEEEAIRKARFFLGLNPNLEKALEHMVEAEELLQRCADTEREGADISYYVNARSCLKQIVNEAPREVTYEHYENNIITFSESYRRQR